MKRDKINLSIRHKVPGAFLIMKKAIIISLLITSYTFAYSQSNYLNIKVFGGTNYTQIDGNGSYDSTHINSSSIYGLGIELKRNNKLTYNIALLYEAKGYHTKTRITDVHGNYEYDAQRIYRFNYLTLPVYASYNLWKVKKHSINLGAGLYAGYLVSNTFEFDAKDELNPPLIEKREYNKFDAGLIWGVSYRYQLNEKFAFSFEASNSQGVISINDNRNYNNSTAITLGVLYRIRKAKEE